LLPGTCLWIRNGASAKIILREEDHFEELSLSFDPDLKRPLAVYRAFREKLLQFDYHAWGWGKRGNTDVLPWIGSERDPIQWPGWWHAPIEWYSYDLAARSIGPYVSIFSYGHDRFLHRGIRDASVPTCIFRLGGYPWLGARGKLCEVRQGEQVLYHRGQLTCIEELSGHIGRYAEDSRGERPIVAMYFERKYKDGPTAIFYPDGGLKKLTYYREGKFHGDYLRYSRTHIIEHRVYDRGKLTQRLIHNGKVLSYT